MDRNAVELKGTDRSGPVEARRRIGGAECARRRRSPRGKVWARSEASAARLRINAASVGSEFTSLLTPTYWASSESWESDAELNRRFALQTQADRHWFLTASRSNLRHGFRRGSSNGAAAQTAGYSPSTTPSCVLLPKLMEWKS